MKGCYDQVSKNLRKSSENGQKLRMYTSLFTKYKKYIVACRYEIPSLVFNLISDSFAALICKISSWTLKEKFNLFNDPYGPVQNFVGKP